MYRVVDALLVRRAVLHPSDLGAWPHTGTSAEPEETCRAWLERVLAVPGFAAALEQASPALAGRAGAVIAGGVTGRDAGRVVLAVMRYASRSTSRATPFGWFAGVAVARLGDRVRVRHGRQHRASVRIPAAWIETQVAELEADAALQPFLTVRTNNLVVESSGQCLLNNRAGASGNTKPVHVKIRTTVTVRAALALARDPLTAGALVSKIAAETGVATARAAKVVAGLIEQRFLLTALRPPMTAADFLGHLVTELDRVIGGAAADPVLTEALHEAPLARLAAVRCRAARLNTLHRVAQVTREPGAWTAASSTITDTAQTISDGELRPGVDVHLACEVTVPHVVADEAASAAALLTRIAAPPGDGWPAWHSQFLDRYGPHALVPVLDVTDADRGLGYPAGFHGGPPAPARTLSGRDQWLLAAAHRAALTQQLEIVLDEAAITAVAAEKPIPQPTTEVTVRIGAATTDNVDRGDFRMELMGMSAWAGRTIGRFLPLFAGDDQRRITAAYPQNGNALPVQVSAPGPYTVAADVTRAPQVLPHLLPVGEYHADQPGLVRLEDVAVTADKERLHLIWMPERRPILPVTMNAVESVRFTTPIVRFLTEAPAALDPPCTFDWGAAWSLPFLPAVRYGRTVLTPAMWLLEAGAVPPPDARRAHFDAALAAWQGAVRCPDRVFLGDGDQLLGLDLTQPSHRWLLRDHLARKGKARLRAPGADNNDWIGGYAHELVIPLAAAAPLPAPTLRTTAVVDVREHGILPASPGHIYLKVYCRPDAQTVILTRHLRRLLTGLGPAAGCWFQRYADPRPHLRLRLNGTINAQVLHSWLGELRLAGLTGDVQIGTDFPETARLGGPDAWAAAERFFTADSEAAVQQLAAASVRAGPPGQALTAASLLDLVGAAFGDPSTGMRWLIAKTRTHRPAPDRHVYQTAVAAADPDRRMLATLPNGPQLLTAWHNRAEALTGYRSALTAAGTDPDRLLPDLLHLHHARIAGPDIDGERACLHLARAAALSWCTRARRHP